MNAAPGLLGQTIAVVDDMLSVDPAPVLTTTGPFLCDVLHRQIQQLEQAVIGREDRSSLGHLPKLPVKSLDRIGGIDQLSQFLREFEISAKIRLIFVPGLCDFRIFAIPDGSKLIQSLQRGRLIHRRINLLQIRHQRLQVLVGHVFAGITKLMNGKRQITRVPSSAFPSKNIQPGHLPRLYASYL